MVGTNEKICTICVFCGGEPEEDCKRNHPKMVQDVYPENVLTKEEMDLLDKYNT